MDERDELIATLKEYIALLGNELDKNITFLYVHGILASEEAIAEGKRLREKIEALEQRIANNLN